MDPVSVVQARDAAMNAGDLEAALALYADDATVRDANPDPGTTGVTRGKEAIRTWLAGNIAGKVRLESFNFNVVGDTVTFKNHVWLDDPDLIRLNLLPVEGNNTLVIRDGKIHDQLIDVSAEWRARAEAAFAADQGAQAGMPKTGAANPQASLAWLVLVGSVSALCGLILRRRAVAH
jgi:hypothetical protein